MGWEVGTDMRGLEMICGIQCGNGKIFTQDLPGAMNPGLFHLIHMSRNGIVYLC